MTESKPRVLVVDDDRAVRESLRRSLQFNGYDVLLAADGAEGLATVGAQHPDVVVMDVMMPRLDGIETTRALRTAGNDVPILVLTARDAVGGGLIRLLIMLPSASQYMALMGAAIGFSVVAVAVAQRLSRGYIHSLERSLLDRAVELELADVGGLARHLATLPAHPAPQA